MSEIARQGKVRALATTGQSRSMNSPDIPTVAEAGVPGYDATIWLGIMAPKGTPADIVARLNAAIRKIAAQDDVKAMWAKQGAIPMSMSSADFDKYLDADIAKWANIVKVAGIKPN